MGLDVCLSDHIYPVAIAEIIPQRTIGIVTRSNGIDVVLLHQSMSRIIDSPVTTYPLSGRNSFRLTPLM